MSFQAITFFPAVFIDERQKLKESFFQQLNELQQYTLADNNVFEWFTKQNQTLFIVFLMSSF